MTLPSKYQNIFIPVKLFLNSYRALGDGKTGIRHLEEYLQSSTFLLSDWKVIWIGTCTLLRTAIDLFQIDKKSCINRKIREELSSEWNLIKENEEDHQIFWKFLRKERNNIVHEYEWAAYEVWMDQDGTMRPPRMSLLEIKPQDTKSILIMRGGLYKGRNSLDLLKESAEWVEARIFDAIHRAGFDPDENRNIRTFKKRPPVEKTLLGGA